MIRVAVGDAMTRNFVSVKPQSSLFECAKTIVKNKGIDSLIVSEGKKLLGILTSHDILWAIIKTSSVNLKQIKAIDIATKKVAVIKPSADISDALQKM